ncbi:hypothetical protein NADFUDRAFT_49016 [Nadsonia fulvescens var. elongata DSM 6958]|uniref:Rab-GAP TBC domain-containing protein n=1 Tax=Nadsonia fulvescens var. elongata DSM 6958 TaxID=857566 RepID=A0A1E3PSH1_9ASCO|nr:hypothetical protein NADFUDRAFT_49016 [Nadsonia fulvescens var. elongata DSM 6958]
MNQNPDDAESLSESFVCSTITPGFGSSWIEMEPHDDNDNYDDNNDITSEVTKMNSINETITQKQSDTKLEQIVIAYKSQDVKALCVLAKSIGGLLSMEWRRKIWPILLGVNDFEAGLSENTDNSNSVDSIPLDISLLDEHVDENQVKLDVNRAFVFYPPVKKEDQDIVKLRKTELELLIVTVLRRNPQLRYYQGYHDIAQVIYLIYGVQDAIKILEFISLFYLRDFMMPTLTPSVDQLELIPALLELADHSLAQLLRETKPFFALSSILTIFSHDISSFDGICFIFDYVFACKNMLSPLFIYVSLIIYRRDDLLPLDASESDIIHSKLSHIPSPLSLSSLFEVTTMAESLIERISPSQLGEPWNTISPYSVLKTTAVLKPIGNQTSEIYEDDGGLLMNQSGYMDGSTLIINEHQAEINNENLSNSNASLNINDFSDSGSESPNTMSTAIEEHSNKPISPISSRGSTLSFDSTLHKPYLSREDIILLSQRQIEDIEIREQNIKEQQAHEFEIRLKAQGNKRAKKLTNSSTSSSSTNLGSKPEIGNNKLSFTSINSMMRHFFFGKNKFSLAYYTKQHLGILSRNGFFSTTVCIGLAGILTAWYCNNNRIDLSSEMKTMWKKFRI